MSLDKFVGSANDYCPHECPNCGGPAYVGGPEFPAKCIEKQCVFYDEDCYVGWIMRLDDSGDPPPGCTEPDYYDIGDEPTCPGITFAGGYKIPPTVGQPYGSYLDTYGRVIGVDRLPGESDTDYYDRLLGVWNVKP